MEYKTFHGSHADELNFEQRKGAANMIHLIEEKINCGHTPENLVIRARSVFNGRVQRGLYTKEETASATVSQDTFLLTSIIDTIEKWDKAVTDIKGATQKGAQNLIMDMNASIQRIWATIVPVAQWKMRKTPPLESMEIWKKIFH